MSKEQAVYWYLWKENLISYLLVSLDLMEPQTMRSWRENKIQKVVTLYGESYFHIHPFIKLPH